MRDTQPNDSVFAQLPERESVSAEIDLNGAWQFKATDEDTWQDACVPGSVHSDLLRLGRIPDPFYRDNEFKVQWVEKKEWEYRRSFEVSPPFLAHDRIHLDCRGLDTITELYLNNERIANTHNMFVEYEFEVKPFLRAGANEIRIVFRSILSWNKQQVAAEPRITWTDEKGNYCFARKSGTDFGWNWGLRVLGCGIWRPIRLAAYDTARVTDLHVRQDLRDPKCARLNIRAEVERFTPRELALEIQVLHKGQVVAQTMAPVANEGVSAQFGIDNPKLWWPNGWGDQSLYTVVARLRDPSLGHTEGLIHTRKLRIGLRTIELVQEKDERGQTFGFKVNGHLIFCKGANWVPAGALRANLTKAHYEHLLASCKEIHVNMLRVWGGGIYEPDLFYDLCDEYGIMVWQDFMFACGPYIASSDYLANVRAEIGNVVRRLRHHPSIALWCGNNEQEGDTRKWVLQYPTVAWEGFDKIFYEVIPQTAACHDRDRPYWPASPHHPLDRKAEKPNYKAASGDAHLWDVWHAGQPFRWFVEHSDFRFVSEFGFYSLPTMETIRSFTVPEDRYFSSRILDLHNKTGRKTRHDEDLGNVTIARYAASMFQMPQEFEDWTYLSQIMHGEGIKIGVETYRRNFPGTTGALYWQLNDNWPTISGSSIDYYGRWKALHYMARRFFNPMLVCGWVEDTRVRIWGVNDLLQEMPGILEWTLARFDGGVVKCGSSRVMLPANCSTMLAELDFATEIGGNAEHTTYRNTNYATKNQHYITYRLLQDERELSSGVAFYAPFKYLELAEPGLRWILEQRAGDNTIALSAERFACFVELGLVNSYARFSDNYFHLLPGNTKKIRILENHPSLEDVRQQIRVKSLFSLIS